MVKLSNIGDILTEGILSVSTASILNVKVSFIVMVFPSTVARTVPEKVGFTSNMQDPNNSSFFMVKPFTSLFLISAFSHETSAVLY